MQDSTFPEQLLLMSDEKKWEMLIRLLQEQNGKIERISEKLTQSVFDQENMANDIAEIKAELKAAKDKITEFERLRIMANGMYAALLAGGGIIAWGASKVWEQFTKH